MRAVFLVGLLALATLVFSLKANAQNATFEPSAPLVSEDLAPPSLPPVPVSPGIRPAPDPAAEEPANATLSPAEPSVSPETVETVEPVEPVSPPQAAEPPAPPVTASPPLGPPPVATSPPPPSVRRAPPPPPAKVPSGEDTFSFGGFSDFPVSYLGALGAFLLVLALLLLFLRLIGRLGRGRSVKGAQTFILRGTMALDARRYLAAVEVDGRLLVVGVTPDRLTSLGEWILAQEDEPFEYLPPAPQKPPVEAKKDAGKVAETKKPEPPKDPGAKDFISSADGLEPILTATPPLKKPPTPTVAPTKRDPTKVAELVTPELIATPPSIPAPEITVPKSEANAFSPDTIELEPLLSFESRELEDNELNQEEPSPLDFTLAIDDDPFTGDDTNDEFLGLDDIEDPLDRRR